jgi:hypothetical protein
MNFESCFGGVAGSKSAPAAMESGPSPTYQGDAVTPISKPSV